MKVTTLTRGVLRRDNGRWAATEQEWDIPPGEFEFLSGEDVQEQFDRLLLMWTKRGYRSIYYACERGELYLAPRDYLGGSGPSPER